MFACGKVQSFGCVILLAVTLFAGCRDSEPPRSYDRDVGTDARPLLPSTRSWHDAAVRGGSAEWHPFQSPTELAAEGDREGEVKPAGGETEAELRSLIEDYNSVVADGDYEEVAEFLVEAQADAVRQIVETLPALADKVRELAEALADGAPQAGLGLQELQRLLAPSQILKLEVDSLSVVSDTQAIGRLPENNSTSDLLAALGLAEIPGEVRFEFDKDDEYWFIDSPVLAALATIIPALKEAIPQLEALTGGLKSGQVPVDAFVGQLGMIGEVLERLKKGAETPAGSETAEEPENAEDSANEANDETEGTR